MRRPNSWPLALQQSSMCRGRCWGRLTGPTGITLQQFNEPAGGQEVYHLHFHILPRREGDRLRPPGQMADMDDLAAEADKIRAALAAA